MIFDVAPVFVYPTLQMHLTAFVVEECEQTAFPSQPPLFTSQLSIEQQWVKVIGRSSRAWFMESERVTCANDVTGWAGVSVASLASTFHRIFCYLVRTLSILVTTAIVHFATICKQRRTVPFLQSESFASLERLTSASDIGCWTSVCVANLATTDNLIRRFTVRTDCVIVTSTIQNTTAIYRIEQRKSRLSPQSWRKDEWIYLYRQPSIQNQCLYIHFYKCT